MSSWLLRILGRSTNETDNQSRKLQEEIDDIHRQLKSMQHSINLLESECSNLRGNFNRKLKGLALDKPIEPPKEEEKGEPKEEEKPQNLNRSGAISFRGMYDVPGKP